MSYEYNPKSNVVFGNVDLSDYNAYAVYCNIFDRPERDISVVSVPGRNGDLIFDNGRYKNVDRTYQIHVVGVENVHNLIRDLTSTIGYQRLEDEYDPNVYMMARLKTKPNVRKFVGNAVLLTVTFDRMPQRWDKKEVIGTSLKSAEVIYDDASSAYQYVTYAFVHSDASDNLKATIKIHGRISAYAGWIWLSVFIRDTQVRETSTGKIYLSDFYDNIDGYGHKIPKKDIFSLAVNVSEITAYTFNVVIDSENQVIYNDDTKETINSGIKDYNKFPEIMPGDNHIYIFDETSTYGVGSHVSSYDITTRKWTI